MTVTQKTSARLRMTGISKSFPGIRALTDVSLEARSGRVHAIVGENGAGKSTLMKVLSGVYAPDAGTIEFDGDEVELTTPADAQKLGIHMVYQELNLVPDLTVAENISLGHMPKKAGFFDQRTAVRLAEKALAELDARIDPYELVGSLTVSQQQLVEITKAYISHPKVIVFDEPTSSLSEHESQVLFGIIRQMRDEGIAVIYISHRLREVLAIADDVTVLRDGSRIESRQADGLSPDDMIQMMVGREVKDIFPKTVTDIGDVALSVRGLTRMGIFHDIDLDVRAGEIVGLAGLVGAGRTEVARAIFGLDPKDAGEVRVNGRRTRIRRPRSAVRCGIGYVPEDRKADGIVPKLSMRSNMSLTVLGSLQKLGITQAARERKLAKRYTDKLAIAPNAPNQKADKFSGGNQQKIVLGKWLATNPTVLILDEPTRGVDVGAKADIHHIIGELASQGVAILMISSELPEIMAVSDRVYVLDEGRVTGEFDRSELSEASVMAAMTGEEVFHE